MKANSQKLTTLNTQRSNALSERVDPIGNLDTKGALYLGLVEHRIGWSGNRTRKLLTVARLDVAVSCELRVVSYEFAGNLLDHLGEIVPGANALVGIVVDSGL